MYRLLIVDDMPVTAASLAEGIDWASVGVTEVETAFDYYEATRILTDHEIHVLITDIRMPGKSGLDLIRSFYEKCPKLHVIIYSAYDDFSCAQEAIQYGVDAFLTKPTSYDEIRTQVKRSLKKLEKTELPASKPSHTPVEVEFSSNPLIRHAQEYIGLHMTETISLQDLADYLHVHPNYISRLFKAEVGITVLDYIIAQKINHAIKLLKQPGMHVSDIPEMIGYESVSYFSRMFKKQTGYSPKEYIKRY